jgi:phosphatidylserine decarboxylase
MILLAGSYNHRSQTWIHVSIHTYRFAKGRKRNKESVTALKSALKTKQALVGEGRMELVRRLICKLSLQPTFTISHLDSGNPVFRYNIKSRRKERKEGKTTQKRNPDRQATYLSIYLSIHHHHATHIVISQQSNPKKSGNSKNSLFISFTYCSARTRKNANKNYKGHK